MKNFPAVCIDNFYSDPDKIREFALAQEFLSNSKGYWPGSRTKEIHLIDRVFFDQFCDKLFSVFFDLRQTTVRYKVKTNFQLIRPISDDPSSPKNAGWVHLDDNTVFAGVIFLTPNIDLNCGTSIFKLIDESKLDTSTAKSDFYRDKIDNNYDEKISMHNSAYIETIRFNNVYNRLICFDAESAHGANSFYSGSQPRLTQVFFVEELETTVPPPILRHRSIL